jgi:hypothetical protein
VFLALSIASGAFWTLAYVLIIRRGFLDRTYGMPLAALCANIAWEFIYAFVLPHPTPQLYINRLWFAFDLVILWQALKFGAAELRYWPRGWFYPAFALALGSGLALVWLVGLELHDTVGAFAAFGQNWMMSLLFLDMLLRRGSLRGQSLYIALCKLLGTACASLTFALFVPVALYQQSLLLRFLYVAILAADGIYVVAVYRRCVAEGIAPWRRL